jgi:WD40 repeat protein
MPYWDVPIDRYYLVDLQTGRIVRRGPAGVTNAVYCDFSPNGRYVTIGGRNGEVVVIDIATGSPVRPAVSAYSGDTFSVRYSSDGDLVTVASTTGQLAVLDGRTGEVKATAALPPDVGVLISNFAPDGTILASGFNGEAYRWDPSIDHAVEFACSVTGRGLSLDEWNDVLPGEPWRRICPP